MSGFYDSSMLYGDQITPERGDKLSQYECVEIEIHFKSGHVNTRYYLTTTTLHAPPMQEGSKVSALPLSIKIPKSSITVMLEESFDPVTKVTAKLECPSLLH